MVHRWLELGLLLKVQIVLEIEMLLETSPSMGKEHWKQNDFGGNDVIFQTAESVLMTLGLKALLSECDLLENS